MREVTYYRGFRFLLHVPESEELISAVSIYHDIFLNGAWIERGHQLGVETLKTCLMEHRQVDVYLLSSLDRSGRGPMRRIRISYDPGELEWFPLDLDAESSEIARERVLLRGALYSQMGDVEEGELPACLVATLRPK